MTAPAGDGIGGLCDRLEAAHRAATVVGLLSDEEHRARVEAEWAVLQAVPDLIRRVRQAEALRAGVLTLAEEWQRTADCYRRAASGTYDNALHQMAANEAARLRAVVADTTGEASR